jgi:aminoglycoside/choline kinase family phosphotransferase
VKQVLGEIRQMMDHLVLGDEEVSKWIEKTKSIDSLVRLPGDASTRKYYRVHSGAKTYIVMRMEPFQEQGEQLPFLVVQKHLSEAGVDVPQVLDVDSSRGFILLEDLGDVTLLRKLQDVRTPDIERHLYEKVIDSLVQLQIVASQNPQKKNLDAFKLRFDHEKLMWEMNFTIENFYLSYLKRTIRKEDLAIMTEGLSEICTFLAAQPTVLTHRDFHSRNVMALATEQGNEERLVMIDFQDARMGPPQYDLASLLKDSYYQLEESQISFLLDYYIARYEGLSQTRIDRAHFIEVFDLMSVQRNFKAIGSFASFLVKRGDATYLKFIGNTFENIRRTLLKYPQYSRLREVLFHYYYF